MNVSERLRQALVASCLVYLSCSHSAAQQSVDPHAPPFHLELSVNRLLIPVVVRDSQGRALSDLKKEDFEVFDEGKLRAISGFTVERRGASEAKPEASTDSASPQSPVPVPPLKVTPDEVILPARITVFLFDDMHLSAEDLAHARLAAVNVLAAALTGTDMAAVVSISGRVNTGLTRDRAKLQDALGKVRPLELYRSDAMECPSIDYYQADLIENKHDPVAVQDANRKFANCNPAVGRPQDVGGGANQPTAENLVEAAASR